MKNKIGRMTKTIVKNGINTKRDRAGKGKVSLFTHFAPGLGVQSSLHGALFPVEPVGLSTGEDEEREEPDDQRP